MNRKKLLYIIGGVAAAVAILAMLYCRFASVTRVATLNFPDFTVEKFIRSNDNPFIKINPIGLDEAEKIAKYDIVLVRIHGSSLNGTHLQAIQKAIAKGVPVYATESDNPEINTLSGRELEYIDALMADTELPQPLQLRPQTHRPQSPLQRTLCGAGTDTGGLLLPPGRRPILRHL